MITVLKTFSARLA